MVLLDAPPFEAVGFGGVLEELEAIDVDELTAPALGGLLRSIGLLRGRVDACEARVVAAFDQVRGAKKDGAPDTKAWLATQTKVSLIDAKRSVQRANAVAALPALGGLLASGAVTAAHVEAIGSIVPNKQLASAGVLVDAATTATPEELRQKAHQFVMHADRDKGASRSERQRAAQKVSFFPTADGLGALYAQSAPERMASIQDAIDLVADDLWRAEHPNRNPQRWHDTTVAYRRAEALYELAKRVLARGPLVARDEPAADDIELADTPATDDPPTTAHGRTRGGSREHDDAELTTAARASARAPKPLAMLLIDYQTAAGQLPLKPVCELGDNTPINPDTMRRLLCDAAIIPAVLNSRGEVLDLGRKIHLPTTAQRRAVFLRDRHCQFPGCRRPAKWSDIHHILWWETGGRTDYSNLLLLCSHHHHLIHEGGWRLHGTAMDFAIHRPDGELFERITRGPP